MQRLIITAPRQAEFEEVAMPLCPPDGLLVQARVTAISTGTEIRVYRLKAVDDAGKFLHANVPFILPTENGYSMVADILEVEAAVSGFAPGERVFVPASHRHVAAIAASLAIKLPAELSDEQAVFLSILEVAHLALRRGNPTPGETVAIIGLGVVGLSALAYCRAFGFRTVAIDKDPDRLAIAQQMGADLAISPDEPRFLPQVQIACDGYGADLVIEAASVWPASQLGMDVAGKGAKIVVVARHTDLPQFSPVGDPYLPVITIIGLAIPEMVGGAVITETVFTWPGMGSLLFSTSIGVVMGALAGYYRGWIDHLIMRVVDVVLSFPVIILLLCVASLVGPSIFNMMAMIGLLTWPVPCRMMRSQFLSIRERTYVEAAHCLGVTDFQIAARHILPNAIAPLLVYASFGVATAVLLEAGLSYLGLGVQPPTPSWGNMLNTARNISTMERNAWQWVPPAIATVLFVLAVNFVGDGIRDALDPQAIER